MEKVESRTCRAETAEREFPVGAELLADGGVSFRVWAPKRRSVQVVVGLGEPDGEPELECDLEAEEGNAAERGYFSGVVPEARVGMLYGFRLDGDVRALPDPASRFQPQGPAGLSQVVDPRGFRWSDRGWKGITIAGQVIYEVHVGSLTEDGTWTAAADRLDKIKAAGMTVVEVMPVADFPGEFGWGYDGVCMFAPTRLYGKPDDFRRFVDRAHALGLGVILDVVYNHFGLIDCTIAEFADEYFSKRHKNEWGSPINFDDEHSRPVRDFFLANVRYWIEEFHLDGFRFDATQQIFDDTDSHILTEMAQTARKAAGGRDVILLAENEPQDVRLVRPVDKGGHGLDAMCNDDFHHSARVRLTGSTEAYYKDFAGTVDELRSAVRGGFLYQGQISLHQHKRRGSPTRGVPATSFIHFLQNHDQVANSGTGWRIDRLTSPGRLRAMTALWLLSPQTPMFFQGQEFAASTPFFYFADFSGNDAKAVAEGRIQFLSQFPSLATEEARRAMADPANRATFERSKLDWSERDTHQHMYDLHSDLLKLRHEDEVFRRQRAGGIEGSALGADCLVLRYFGHDVDEPASDRLVVANFGNQFCSSPSPEPLLAPPAGARWEILWSSAAVRYGGPGTPPLETDDGWNIPAEAAVVLKACNPRVANSADRTPE